MSHNFVKIKMSFTVPQWWNSGLKQAVWLCNIGGRRCGHTLFLVKTNQDFDLLMVQLPEAIYQVDQKDSNVQALQRALKTVHSIQCIQKVLKALHFFLMYVRHLLSQGSSQW